MATAGTAVKGPGGEEKGPPAKVASATSKGQGDLDTVVLRHSGGATAEIYLFGATLCSYKTPAGKEQIFVSPGAIYDGKKAIRGGVPVVFPQFGQPDKAMAQHGFARSTVWSIKEIADSEEDARVILTLSDSEATRAVWNYPFSLEYIVVLTATSLKMTLRAENTGDAPFSFNFLLHTYFDIPDVGEVAVRGLAGRSYIDKVDGGTTKEESGPEIILHSFTDRVYVGKTPGAKDVTIGTKDGSTMFAVINEGFIAGEVQPCDVVVWNPYEDASPGDLPTPAFKNFICVEPGLVSKPYDLPSKAIAELSQTILPNAGAAKAVDAQEWVEAACKDQLPVGQKGLRVSIPAGTTAINTGAFVFGPGQSPVSAVDIPCSVTKIGGFAFANSEIEEVSIPASVKTLEMSVFNGCKKLAKVDIPEGVSEIKEQAFMGCVNLVDIRIPDSVEKMAVDTFTTCHSLRNISIPAKLADVQGNRWAAPPEVTIERRP
jgi:glucose-6-phosphate 1-epimerase